MNASPSRTQVLGYTLSVCLMALPSIAQANAREDIFGAGARSKAMGGAATALVTGWSAVYHNPANLSFSNQTSMSILTNQRYHTVCRNKNL